MPSNEGVKEGEILREFMRLIDPDDSYANVHFYKAKSRNQLIQYLKNKNDLDEFEYFHLSGHGNADERLFYTPNGFLIPEDFPEACFADKTVTLSSCTLGKFKFIDGFMDQTWASNVIAPKKEVEYINAAIFYLMFYYWALYQDVKPSTAYDHALDACNGVKGGFEMWEQ